MIKANTASRILTQTAEQKKIKVNHEFEGDTVFPVAATFVWNYFKIVSQLEHPLGPEEMKECAHYFCVYNCFDIICISTIFSERLFGPPQKWLSGQTQDAERLGFCWTAVPLPFVARHGTRHVLCDELVWET